MEITVCVCVDKLQVYYITVYICLCCHVAK